MFRITGVSIALMLVSLAVPNRAEAATIAATSCAASAVQSALNHAADGDTVTVPAGTCTWDIKVTGPSDRGVRLVGAGIGKTIIKRGLLLRDAALELYAPAGTYTEVTGFTCDSQASAEVHAFCIAIQSGKVQGQNTFRVHDNAFTNIHRRGLYLGAAGVISSGLVDHNTFYCGSSTSCQGVAGDNCETGDDATTIAMSAPMGFGGPIQNYIEDNTFIATRPQDGAYDNYSCGRGTMRFNTLRGFNMGHHGTELRRGTQQWEMYNNHIDTSSYPSGVRWSGRWVHHRSGTGYFFNNTATSDMVGRIEFYMYRMDPTVPLRIWDFMFCTPENPLNAGPHRMDGRLGGTAAWASRPVGWPCLDQSGWWFDRVGNFQRAPSYVWENRRAGTLVPATLEPNRGQDGYIKEDFEYFNQNPTFDGKSGIGVGLRRDMNAITSCTEWVGFWVTDEGNWNMTNGATPDGQLYVCRSNQWTLRYTPYTYPHPLQSGPPVAEGPKPPSNLRIVSSN